jgi:RND family efflux transporter MFP subunit
LRLPRKHKVSASTEEPGTAFDAFDDRAEEMDSPTYGHVPVAPECGKRTGRGIGVLAALIAIGLTGAFFTVSKLRARETFELEQETRKNVATVPLVDVALVKPGPANKSLILPAETAAWYRTTIYARVNGYLANWKVDIGDRVKKGQVLATIETPDLDSQLDAARAELKAAQAETKVKEADASFARSSYDRWRDSPKGVVSDQEREAKKAANESSAARLNAAIAKVAVDQAKVDGLTTLTEFKNVTAPFDGIITERRVDPGDLVTAGSAASTTPLFVIQQADRIRVFTSAPQGVASRLTIGSTVRVTSGDGTGRAYEGKITRMTGSLDPHARTMRIEVVLPNADYALAPGMYVRTELRVNQKPSVQVPASAIIFRSKGPQVAVVGSGGKISFRDVTIISDDGEFIDLGSGVKAGENVALNINSQIADGEKVAINSSPKAQS